MTSALSQDQYFIYLRLKKKTLYLFPRNQIKQSVFRFLMLLETVTDFIFLKLGIFQCQHFKVKLF
jgi:hypothetical protein